MWYFLIEKNRNICYIIIAIFMFIFFLICSHVSEPCYIAFHDEEWGVPVHDDKYVGLLWCWHNLLFSLSFDVAIVSQCGNLVFVQETV